MNYLTNSIDRVLFGGCPTLMQPLHGDPLPPPELSKHRFVCTQDGLYLEAHNAVIEVRQQIAPSTIRLPYGKAGATGVMLKHGKIPQQILQDALTEAAMATPNEWAGLVVWNEPHSTYELFKPTILSTTPGHISYANHLPDGLVLVMDIHSHGNGEAFFSETDNQSDLSGFYVAAVLGNCRHNNADAVTRMVVNGHFLVCSSLPSFFCQ